MAQSRATSIQDGPGPVQASGPGQVVIAALGDLMLAGEWDERVEHGTAITGLQELRSLCGEAVVFGNLEVTLDGGSGVIEKQPRIIAAPETLTTCLEALDPDVVSVANNHAFDALWSGFEAVRRILDAQDIAYLGAGSDLSEAGRPLVLDRNGVRLGWLAYADAATRPSHSAGPDSFGVNPFDEKVASEQIRRLKRAVDHVLVSLHWGIEYSHVPSPRQVCIAHGLIDQGASLVLGHHAHVTQGVEQYRGRVIAYNLGNALATDLAIDGRPAIRQTTRSRSSFVLRAVLTKSRVERTELVPFRLRGGEVLARDLYADRLLARANRRVEVGISPVRWRAIRLYEDVILRTARKLHPRVIGSIRARHFASLLKNVASALRGRGPA